MKFTSLSIFLGWSLVLAAQAPAQYQISGPFTHENLSLFLVQMEKGDKHVQHRYLTLRDAMDQEKVVVHETKKVNELAVENVSNEEIFIQSGDIVKGGQQDRVITNDFVLPSRSGRIAVAVFCVEQGRWTQRGNESAATFNSSTEMVATKPLKIAVGVKKDQSEVWRNVAEAQANLALSTAQTVTVSASTSSLPLTLRSSPVEHAVKGYTKALERMTEGKRNAVGYVAVVNGALNSADVYSSPELFVAMWPKLLTSSSVEAVRLKVERPYAPVPAAKVEEFLREAERGEEAKIEVDRRITLVRRESEQQITMESRNQEAWIHKSIIKK
jgi:hypothetical protein